MGTFNKISPIYGYVVCLVSIIVILISMTAFINATFDYAQPAQSNSYAYRFSSFETYKANNAVTVKSDVSIEPAKLTDAELRSAFDTEKATQLEQVKFSALKSIITSGFMILLSLVLFVWHWRWLSHLPKEAN